MWTGASLLGILCLVILAPQILGLDEVLGRRSTFPSVVPASTFDPEDICNGTFGTTCGDCFNHVFCLGPTTPPKVTQCDNERRYCNKELNMCVSDVPAGQDDCASGPKIDFQCTGTGFFPHPTNCSIYYECLENGIAFDNECPPGYAWATIDMKCRQRLTTKDCGTINCKSYPDTFQVLSSNSSFYAYCGKLVNGLQDIIVFRCERPNEVFNIAKLTCEFQCPEERLYADPNDQTYYYQCYKSGANLVYQYKQCTGGRTFSEPDQICKSA